MTQFSARFICHGNGMQENTSPLGCFQENARELLVSMTPSTVNSPSKNQLCRKQTTMQILPLNMSSHKHELRIVNVRRHIFPTRNTGRRVFPGYWNVRASSVLNYAAIWQFRIDCRPRKSLKRQCIFVTSNSNWASSLINCIHRLNLDKSQLNNRLTRRDLSVIIW